MQVISKTSFPLSFIINHGFVSSLSILIQSLDICIVAVDKAFWIYIYWSVRVTSIMRFIVLDERSHFRCCNHRHTAWIFKDLRFIARYLKTSLFQKSTEFRDISIEFSDPFRRDLGMSKSVFSFHSFALFTLLSESISPGSYQ